MKPAVLLLALVSLLLAVALALFGPSGAAGPVLVGPDLDVEAGHSTGRALPELDDVEAPADSDEPAELVRAPGFQPMTVVTGYTETPDIVPPEYTLAGQLIAVGIDGSPLPPVNGYLEMTLPGSLFELEKLTDGTFMIRSSRLIAPDRVTPIRFSAEGSAFEFHRDDCVREATGGELVFLAHELPRIRLHVVSDRTGGELSHVMIRTRSGGGSSGLQIPSPQGRWRDVVTDVNSPVDLTPLLQSFRGQRVVTIVGASGFAWTSIAVDVERDAELTVRLEPAADVRVQLVPGQPHSEDDPVNLWVVAGEGPDCTVVARFETTMSGRVPLVGLRAGDYRLQVEYASPHAAAQLLADEPLHLLPGKNGTVRVPCSPILDSERGTVSFALHVSEEWGIKTPLATMSDGRRSLALEARRLGPSEWLLENDLVEPGRYFFDLDALGLSGLVEVPKGGLERVPIHVPDPIALDVVFVDDVTGSPAPVDTLTWYLLSPWHPSSEGLSSPSGSWHAGARRGPAHFKVAPGRLRFGLYAEGKMLVESEFTLEVSTTLELRVQDLQQILFKFTEDGQPVHTPMSWLFAAEFEGPGEPRGFTTTEVGVAVAMSKPGTYSVRLPAFRGLEAAGPFEVVVPQGGEGRLEVEVVRAASAAVEKE
jgi:hypothetical protein